jgi:general secretion pathway protein A
MYEAFYNLRERPFALSPDPGYFYLSRVHREALEHLRYGVESRAGFIVVTGEIGAGKTTLLQTLVQRLSERTVIARLVNTMLDPRELLEMILLEFGLETAGKSKPTLLRDFARFLVQQRRDGRHPLLIVDEAQNLSTQALEEIRLLSNLETEKSKLVQILLVGQPDLRDTIASPALEQFRQRIAVSYHLPRLDAEETASYVAFRLARAAVAHPPVFSPGAAALVYEASLGVPRIINVVCDAALLFGYAEGQHAIDQLLIQAVVDELATSGVVPRRASAVDSAFDEHHEIVEAAASDVAAPAAGLPGAAESPEIAVGYSPAASGELPAPEDQLFEPDLLTYSLNQPQIDDVAEIRRDWNVSDHTIAAAETPASLHPRADPLPDWSARLSPLYSPVFGTEVKSPVRRDHFWQRFFRVLMGAPALRS